MANPIDICNLALTRVGAGRIASFADQTEEAIACNILYPSAKEAVLRDHDWSFARRPATLALLTETHPEWDFVYAVPADYIAARRIFNPASKRSIDAIDYDTGLAASGNQIVILTDQPDAILIYTVNVQNSGVFDAAFCDALSWKLAAELAQPLRAESALAAALANRYLQQLADAKYISSNEQRKEPETGSSFVEFRQ